MPSGGFEPMTSVFEGAKTVQALIRAAIVIGMVYIYILAYFPGVARVVIYPNLIVICVPSLADNFYAPWRFIAHTSADLHTVTSSH
jgi:hypothetical protein